MKHESFTIEKIHRSEISGAPYNPRKITASAKKKLRKSLRDFGLLAPITFNKTTGNIVGGHQRIDAMDSLNRTQDYELTVAMVEMTAEEEVKANIVLNNPSVMGSWDEELLAEINTDFPEIDFEKDLGFDKYDLDMILPEEEFYQHKEEKTEEDRIKETDKLKEAKKRHREESKEKNAQGKTYQIEKDDYMVTVVFNTTVDKQEFMKHMGERPQERYIKYTKIYDIQDGKRKAYGRLKSHE